MTRMKPVVPATSTSSPFILYRAPRDLSDSLAQPDSLQVLQNFLIPTNLALRIFQVPLLLLPRLPLHLFEPLRAHDLPALLHLALRLSQTCFCLLLFFA